MMMCPLWVSAWLGCHAIKSALSWHSFVHILAGLQMPSLQSHSIDSNCRATSCCWSLLQRSIPRRVPLTRLAPQPCHLCLPYRMQAHTPLPGTGSSEAAPSS